MFCLRTTIKQDIQILQESVKKFSRNNGGFQAVCLDKALASWLAARWAGCRLPRFLHFPVEAAGSLGSQQASVAAGQLSIQESNQRGGKQRSLAAGKSRETLEGSHSHEKCQLSDFSFWSRRKYIHVCVCVYVYLYIRKKSLYVRLCICTPIFKCCFLWENKSLFQLAVMSCSCPMPWSL